MPNAVDTIETVTNGLTGLVKPPKQPLPFEAQLKLDALLYTVGHTIENLLEDNELYGGFGKANPLSHKLYEALRDCRGALCYDGQPPYDYSRLTPADLDAIKRIRPDLWEMYGPDPDEKNGGMAKAIETENGRKLAASRPHLQELVDKLRAMEAEDPHNDHLRERAEDMLTQFNDIAAEFDHVWERVNSICESYARIDAA